MKMKRPIVLFIDRQRSLNRLQTQKYKMKYERKKEKLYERERVCEDVHRTNLRPNHCSVR